MSCRHETKIKLKTTFKACHETKIKLKTTFKACHETKTKFNNNKKKKKKKNVQNFNFFQFHITNLQIL